MSDISSIISSNVKYTEHIGGDIDHVQSSLPDGCPYTFDKADGTNDWQWIKTGDDMQSADVNFYGNVTFNHADLENCRWKIGAV